MIFSCYDKIILTAKSEQALKHVFGSEGKVAGTDCQTLACALDITVLYRNLTYNGPAIKGVCVGLSMEAVSSVAESG
jgi:hypothetical protein